MNPIDLHFGCLSSRPVFYSNDCYYYHSYCYKGNCVRSHWNRDDSLQGDNDDLDNFPKVFDFLVLADRVLADRVLADRVLVGLVLVGLVLNGLVLFDLVLVDLVLVGLVLVDLVLVDCVLIDLVLSVPVHLNNTLTILFQDVSYHVDYFVHYEYG